MSNVSIGHIGMPYFDETNDRTKAFIIGWHTTVTQVLETIRRVTENVQGTRLSLRIMSENIPLKSLQEISFGFRESEISCEAIIPINHHGKCIAYYGWNNLVRKTPQHQREDERILLDTIMRRNGTKEYSYNGYRPEATFPGQIWEERDIERLVAIYRLAFSGYLVEFTRESVSEMLISNQITVVRDSGTIVAVAMAEIAEIEINSQTIRLAEISEVATHPSFHRRGLSHLAFKQLTTQLRKQQMEVIFTETRAASYGMMAVAWDAGMKPRGMLEKHCVISSPYSEVSQDGKYGDLVVFSLSPTD